MPKGSTPCVCLVAALTLSSCQVGGTQEEEGDVTYYEDVAPILNRACGGCHVEGGIAPFSLETYASSKDVAKAVKSATADRRMPPIAVDTSGECNTFDDPRVLTDDEIALIGRWVDEGTLEGDPNNAPQRPVAITLPSVDASADPGVEYQPNVALDDDYRCFVLDAVSSTDVFLTAYEVHPGQPSEVHHVVLYATDTPAEEANAVGLDAGEAGPGYTCFGGPGTGSSRTLAVWAPGTGATFYPESTGLRIVGGRKMVMQVHYNQPTVPDRTTIDLKLESSVPREALLTGVLDLGLNLAPGSAEAVETNTMTYPASAVAYRIWGVYPHMHQLGRTMHVELEQLGQKQCVVDVPRYDFGYQQFFFYDEPIVVPPGPGASVTIECTYDTRGATETTTWGEGTSDEMCIAGFYVTL